MSEQQLNDNFTCDEYQLAHDILRCQHGAPTTDKFRRMVMFLLQGHYASSENYPEAFNHLSCYHWSTEEKDRTIHIGFTHQRDDEKPDNYPGIYVGFGGTELEKAALGNFAGRSTDKATDRLTKVAKLELTVDHVAKEASNAADLAEMSAAVMTALARPFALNSGALSFEVNGFRPPREKNQAPNYYYTVALHIEILYNHAVTRGLESHRIRQIISTLAPDHQ